MRLLLILFCLLSIVQCKTDEKRPVKHGPHRPIMPRKPCSGKPTVIAVIDTGFGVEDKGEDKWLGQENVKLCKFGHKNFVDDNNSDKFDTKSPVPVDTHGHGTHIAGIIDKYARAGNAN